MTTDRPRAPRPVPPRAPRRPVVRERFGVRLADPYAWLRDPDWRRVMRDPDTLAPEIRAHLEAENAYCAAVLAPTEALQDALFAEMKGRIKEDDSTVPARDGPWAYYRRFAAGGQYPICCRRPADADGDEAAAHEHVLLDGNREAEGHGFWRLAGAAHAPDHRLFAWAADVTGAEYHTIRIRDLAAGATLDEALENAQGDMVWAADGRTLFYTVLDDNHRPWRVMRHGAGTPAKDDAVVYENPDPAFFVEIGRTESGRFVTIEARDHADTGEVRVIPTDAPESAPRLIAPRRDGVRYRASDHGERWMILTNAAGALDFRIATAPLAAAGPEHWRDVVAHRPGRLIRAMLLFADFLVRLEREDGVARIVIRRLADGDEHAIAFAEEAFELGLVPGFEYATATLRFAYSSPATPERIYDYDMAARTRRLRKTQEIPSGHDPAAYRTRRLFATAGDGARVPITVLHAKDTPLDGSAPLLLYGYGAYGHAIPAAFAPNRLSLVDRGFVYAIAHVRGGTEGGYRWYLDGKLANKKNSFADFVAAAEHLCAAGVTAAGNIVAHGASAGGMLVGAAANMRPDLFGAVIAEVPFVDVLNTMSDASLPLTPPEWVEWGNPIEDEAAFRAIAAYCPYTNVRRQPYPHVFATGGLADPRVTYWEPAKWVAKLRAEDTGDALILLRTNMGAGHGGAAGRFDRLREVARAYAFALMVCGRAGD